MRASIHVRSSIPPIISNAKVSDTKNEEQQLFTLLSHPYVHICLYFSFTITETDEILSDTLLCRAEVKNHDLHIGSIATSSMRKSINLSNGANNAGHTDLAMSSGTGKGNRGIMRHYVCVCVSVFGINLIYKLLCLMQQKIIITKCRITR